MIPPLVLALQLGTATATAEEPAAPDGGPAPEDGASAEPKDAPDVERASPSAADFGSHQTVAAVPEPAARPVKRPLLVRARPAGARPVHPRGESQPPMDRRDTEEEPAPSRWYGWETLAMDGAALLFIPITVVAAGASADAALPFAALGAGIYLVGPAVVHGTHGQHGSAGVSLAIRVPAVGITVLGAVAAALGGGEVLLPVGLIGMVAAIPIDAANAYEDPPIPSETATRGARRVQVGLAAIPGLQPRRPTATVPGLSVSGAF